MRRVGSFPGIIGVGTTAATKGPAHALRCTAVARHNNAVHNVILRGVPEVRIL